MDDGNEVTLADTDTGLNKVELESWNKKEVKSQFFTLGTESVFQLFEI